MRQLLFIISLLGLCHLGKCGDFVDLSLEQLKSRLPDGIIPGHGPLGAMRSLGCSLDSNETSPRMLDYKKRGAIFVWVHAFEDSESGVGYLIEVRGTITLKAGKDYRVKGYESGEFVRDATDQATTAEPVLRYHPFFVLTEAVESGHKVPGS